MVTTALQKTQPRMTNATRLQAPNAVLGMKAIVATQALVASIRPERNATFRRPLAIVAQIPLVRFPIAVAAAIAATAMSRVWSGSSGIPTNVFLSTTPIAPL